VFSHLPSKPTLFLSEVVILGSRSPFACFITCGCSRSHFFNPSRPPLFVLPRGAPPPPGSPPLFRAPAVFFAVQFDYLFFSPQCSLKHSLPPVAPSYTAVRTTPSPHTREPRWQPGNPRQLLQPENPASWFPVEPRIAHESQQPRRQPVGPVSTFQPQLSSLSPHPPAMTSGFVHTLVSYLWGDLFSRFADCTRATIVDPFLFVP
jgi:hypothetical protein